MKYLLGILTILLCCTSCKKKGCMDETAINYSALAEKDDGSCEYNSGNWGPYNPTPMQHVNPFENFPDVEEPSWNPTTVQGFQLGRKLFYDDILSMNGNSCSTCHPQDQGFAFPTGSPTSASIPPFVNLGWRAHYGWTGGATALDSVALADLEEGNIFLNANNDSILARLEAHPDYPRMFWEAFGVEIVLISLPERQKYISYALAQFLRGLVSGDSKFDKYRRGETTLTLEEYQGYALFMDENKGDCFHCHGSIDNPMWTDDDFHNNGLDATHTLDDMGRYWVTNDPNDIGKFRTPTLRNIELTGPYMHDGRFATLEEVLNFYSTGLQMSETIDPLMKNASSGGAGLTPEEQDKIIAFLKTLTDEAFITNTYFGPP